MPFHRLTVLNGIVAWLYLLMGSVSLLLVPRWPHLVFATAAFLLMAAPYAYLTVTVRQRRGRGLQTAMAVLSLLKIPFGTAYGSYALWAVWSGPDAHLFGPAVTAPPPPPEPEEDPSESAYAYAKRLVAHGFSSEALRLRLERRGLDEGDLEALFGALQLRLPPRRRAS